MLLVLKPSAIIIICGNRLLQRCKWWDIFVSRGRNVVVERKRFNVQEELAVASPPYNWMLLRVREKQHNAPPLPYSAVLSRSARSPAGRALSPSPANEFTPQPSLKMTAGRMAMGRLLVKLSTRANLIRHGIAHLPRTELSSAHPILCFTVYKLIFPLLFLYTDRCYWILYICWDPLK